MKKTIALLTTLITLVTLVVYISTASAASPAGCPTGYICTPTVPVAAVVCPVGYVCTPQSAASGSAATPTYVQGSFYRTYLSGAGSRGATNTPATTYTNTNANGATSSASSMTNMAASSSSTQAIVSGVNYGAPFVSTKVSDGLPLLSDGVGNPALFANVGTPVGFTVQSVGSKLIPRCAAGQYWYDFGYTGAAYLALNHKPNGGCYTNPYPQVPIVFNPGAKNGSTVTMVTDPYCNVTQSVANFIEGNASTTGCIIGEASRNSSYTNPWLTLSNLFGIKQSRPSVNKNTLSEYAYSSDHETNFGTNRITTAKLPGSNICKNIVSLQHAKVLSEQLKSQGVTNDYMSNSRLIVHPFEQISLYQLKDGIFRMQSSTYHEDPLPPGADDYTGLKKGQIMKQTRIFYRWDGVKLMTSTNLIDQSGHRWVDTPASTDMTDVETWANPVFQSVFQNAQFLPSWLSKCLDPDFKNSNFPQWASHFGAAMNYLKAQGVVQ